MLRPAFINSFTRHSNRVVFLYLKVGGMLAKKRISKGRIERMNENYIQHSSAERIGICEDCGAHFERVWVPKYDMYSNQKTCGACRMAKANGFKKVTIPYTPHEAQQKIHDSQARFKILVCGNRFGKDLGSIGEGVMKFIEMNNEERSVDVNPPVLWWIVAPNMRLARQNWRDLKKLLPKELVHDISLSNLTIETINGGIIEVHSADDPETLVGVGLDVVTITEAARVRDLDTVWANLRQRLDSPGRGPGGKGGVALINSTPKGRTYFYKLSLMGDKTASLYSPSYETFHFSTWDNPYMSEKRHMIVGEDSMGEPITFEDELRMGMTEARYRQDYLAEFIMEINAVFPHYERVLVKPPTRKEDEIAEFWDDWEKPDPFETYTIGYDPASKGDGKPCIIRDSKGKIMKIDLMARLGWDAQWDRLAMYSRLYNGATVNFGQTGIGETIGSQLTKRGIPNVPINEQGNNKAKLVEDLAVIVEQQWCQIPWSSETEKQLQDYVSVDREGRSTQYHNATDSGHDDIISGLYFCFSDFQSPALILPWVGIMSGVGKDS